jgi:O-antigen ligase
VTTVLNPQQFTYSRGYAWALGLLIGIAVPVTYMGNLALAIAFGFAALLAAVAMANPSARHRAKALAKTRVGTAALLTLLWWGGVTITSIDPVSSIQVVSRMAVYIMAFIWVIVALAERPKARQIAESSIMIGSAVLGTLAVVAVIVEPSLLYVFKPLHEGPIMAENMFKSLQSVLALTVPVLLYLAWQRRGVWIGVVSIALICDIALFAGITGQTAESAIGGMMGASLILFLLLLARYLSRRGRVFLIIAILSLCVAVGLSVFQVLPHPPTTEKDVSSPPLPVIDFHRQAIWGFVYQKALDAPVTGYGINTINKTKGALELVPGLQHAEYVPGHPHNWILEIWSETGIVGLFLFCITQLLLVIAVARTALRGNGSAWIACAVMASFWTSSLANFSIWASWWQVSFLCVLALPVSQLLADRHKTQ